jgi:hypothetical protein
MERDLHIVASSPNILTLGVILETRARGEVVTFSVVRLRLGAVVEQTPNTSL